MPAHGMPMPSSTCCRLYSVSFLSTYNAGTILLLSPSVPLPSFLSLPLTCSCLPICGLWEAGHCSSSLLGKHVTSLHGWAERRFQHCLHTIACHLFLLAFLPACTIPCTLHVGFQALVPDGEHSCACLFLLTPGAWELLWPGRSGQRVQFWTAAHTAGFCLRTLVRCVYLCCYAHLLHCSGGWFSPSSLRYVVLMLSLWARDRLVLPPSASSAFPSGLPHLPILYYCAFLLPGRLLLCYHYALILMSLWYFLSPLQASSSYRCANGRMDQLRALLLAVSWYLRRRLQRAAGAGAHV